MTCPVEAVQSINQCVITGRWLLLMYIGAVLRPMYQAQRGEVAEGVQL